MHLNKGYTRKKHHFVTKWVTIACIYPYGWCATWMCKCLNEINRIHEERWGWLPRTIILYDGRKDIQIVKLMVGVVHEYATCFDEINRIHEERWGWLPHMPSSLTSSNAFQHCIWIRIHSAYVLGFFLLSSKVGGVFYKLSRLQGLEMLVNFVCYKWKSN